MSSSNDYELEHDRQHEHELDNLEASRRYPPLPLSPPLGRHERFPLSASSSANSNLAGGGGRSGIGGFALSTGGAGGAGGTTTTRYGRAFGSRILRTVRRGQLPFLLVFFACVIIFFTALTGIGYVDPDAISASAALADLDAPEVDFMPGQPVFDAGVAHGGVLTAEEARRAEMRKLEQEWSRQKRPKDGAWMHKQRDQRAVRRKPLPNSPGERQRLSRANGGAQRDGDEPLDE